MAVIEVDRLHTRYGDTVAVDDVSFTVEGGEIFGILGPNRDRRTLQPSDRDPDLVPRGAWSDRTDAAVPLWHRLGLIWHHQRAMMVPWTYARMWRASAGS
jgi:hypothetical protein